MKLNVHPPNILSFSDMDSMILRGCHVVPAGEDGVWCTMSINAAEIGVAVSEAMLLFECFRDMNELDRVLLT